MGGDGGADLAPVEGLALRRGDAAQTLRRGREGEPLGDLGGPAMRHEGLGPAGLRLQERCRGDPLLPDHDRHRITALADLDRRCQQVGEGQLAEAFR